jgi:hypothetical protein
MAKKLEAKRYQESTASLLHEKHKEEKEVIK